MSETSTTEQLFLYLYNETGMSDSVLIQKEIDNDPETEAEFENIKAAMNFLDRALLTPSSACVQNILAYSEKTAVRN